MSEKEIEPVAKEAIVREVVPKTKLLSAMQKHDRVMDRRMKTALEEKTISFDQFQLEYREE